jgi:purine-binding chemotaxis protein CheW
MEINNLSDFPCVIVTLNKEFFGISAAVMKSMVLLKDVVAVPQVPAYIRGVMNLRGAALRVVDMRVRLGMKSFTDEINELCTMLEQREEDHKNWLAKLEACVRENRAIDVQTDPHKCAFGKWYDSFHSNNVVLSGMLGRFDAPHKRIHGLAHAVGLLMAQKKTAEAQEMIEACRGKELAEMIRLFNEVRNYLRTDNREIAVVLEGRNGDFIIAVDGVESVEILKEGSIESLTNINKNSTDKGLIPFIGCRKKTDAFVKLMDVEYILK